MIRARLEAEARGVEFELGVPDGHGGALLVLRLESEDRLAGERRIRQIGARRRVDRSPAGDEPGGRVVDNDHDALGVGAAVIVGTGQDHRVDASLVK